MVDDVVLGEVEKRIFLQQRVLELIGFRRWDLHVGSDAAAAVNGAATVGHLDFVVGVIGVVVAIVVVIVVKRDAAVIALDQAAARGVILCGRQRQSGILRQRIHGLHQTLAECGFTGNQSPIMVLNRARDDLRCGSRSAVHQHHQRIILASIAVTGFVNLLCGSAPVMRNDDLSLLQELVGHAHAFAQQSAGILAQVEDEPVNVAQLIQRVAHFFFRGFLKSRDVDVADTRTDHKMHVHAVAGDLIAHHGKVKRLLRPFAQHRNLDRGALGPFQQLGNIAGSHVVGRPAIHRDNHIARPDTGFIGWRAGEGRDHDDFVVAGTDLHAHTVVLAALLLAQSRIGLGIEKV